MEESLPVKSERELEERVKAFCELVCVVGKRVYEAADIVGVPLQALRAMAPGHETLDLALRVAARRVPQKGMRKIVSEVRAREEVTESLMRAGFVERLELYAMESWRGGEEGDRKFEQLLKSGLVAKSFDKPPGVKAEDLDALRRSRGEDLEAQLVEALKEVEELRESRQRAIEVWEIGGEPEEAVGQ